MKINSNTTSQEVKEKMMTAIGSMTSIGGFSLDSEPSTKRVIPNDSEYWIRRVCHHATVKERDEKEVMDIISDVLRKEEQERTEDIQQQDGDCFETALNGSRIFLETKNKVLNKVMTPSRKK